MFHWTKVISMAPKRELRLTVSVKTGDPHENCGKTLRKKETGDVEEKSYHRVHVKLYALG